jgi:4-carboxymuconolactone decarboxylase
MSEERLPSLSDAALTDAQRRVMAKMVSGPRGAVVGPFIPLLRSPELADRVQALGEHVRYDSAIPLRLREWAICVTARCWDQAFEWHAHAPLARKAGVAHESLAALVEGKKPANAPEDEAIIYDFVFQAHEHRQVDDKAYAAALDLLGEAGVVDLMGLCGYYALLALVLNVSRASAPQPHFAVPA